MADTKTTEDTETEKPKPIYCTVRKWCDSEFPTEVPADYIQRGVTSCEECSKMCIACNQMWHPNRMYTHGLFEGSCVACFDLAIEEQRGYY